jgi:hypothetical protein
MLSTKEVLCIPDNQFGLSVIAINQAANKMVTTCAKSNQSRLNIIV